MLDTRELILCFPQPWEPRISCLLFSMQVISNLYICLSDKSYLHTSGSITHNVWSKFGLLYACAHLEGSLNVGTVWGFRGVRIVAAHVSFLVNTKARVYKLLGQWRGLWAYGLWRWRRPSTGGTLAASTRDALLISSITPLPGKILFKERLCYYKSKQTKSHCVTAFLPLVLWKST